MVIGMVIDMQGRKGRGGEGRGGGLRGFQMND